MYSKSTGLIFGFHGCDQSVIDTIITNPSRGLRSSTNEYDWLGHGIYFWEKDPSRVLEFAKESSKRKNSKITKPAVLGAILNLGYCLDLLNINNNDLVKTAYKTLVQVCNMSGSAIPENSNPPGARNSEYHFLRNLDCAVIQLLHHEQDQKQKFDSVRGMFPEGEPLYPNSGFRTKNHIQICVRNPNCIKGYFLPRHVNGDWIIP